MLIQSLDRTKSPKFIIPETFNFQKVESFFLSNGVVIHSLAAGNQPIVKLELSFVGGTCQDNASFESYFTSKLLDQGTRTKTNEEIAEYVAFRGAHLEVISGNEKIVITLYSLKKHLHDMCILLFEILNESEFASDNLERIKINEKQNLEVKETKTSHIASTNFVGNLFPNHYYGKRLDSSAILGIELENLKKFYSKFLKGTSFEICISGAVDNKCIETINSIFGSQTLKSNQFLEQEIFESKVGFHKADKEGAVQASLRYGFQTIDKKHPDYPLFSIVNEIFGGYFGSRLMTNIREDKGFTYGIGSYIVQLKNASYFQISTDVKAEKLDETVSEVQKEIEILCNEHISQIELDKVRNYIFGSFATSLNTPFELMDKFKAVNLLGMDYNFYNKYFDILKQVNSTDIMEISQKYLSSKAVISVCG